MSETCQQETHAPQQMKPLFNHLVGAQEQGRWQRQPYRLRRFHIDDELKFGRLNKGNIGRFGAVKDFCDLTCCQARRQTPPMLPRCLIPRFDGALFSGEWKDALWDRFFTAAPQRQRQCDGKSVLGIQAPICGVDSSSDDSTVPAVPRTMAITNGRMRKPPRSAYTAERNRTGRRSNIRTSSAGSRTLRVSPDRVKFNQYRSIC
jgi:hypothetical protein